VSRETERTLAINLKPFMCGITRSVIMRSKLWVANNSIAWAPSLASVTSYPALLRRSAIVARVMTSSSTRRIFPAMAAPPDRFNYRYEARPLSRGFSRFRTQHQKKRQALTTQRFRSVVSQRRHTSELTRQAPASVCRRLVRVGLHGRLSETLATKLLREPRVTSKQEGANEQSFD